VDPGHVRYRVAHSDEVDGTVWFREFSFPLADECLPEAVDGVLGEMLTPQGPVTVACRIEDALIYLVVP
jgi:hypothetical protein